MMRSEIALLVLVLFVVAVAGCKGGEPAAGDETPADSETPAGGDAAPADISSVTKEVDSSLVDEDSVEIGEMI